MRVGRPFLILRKVPGEGTLHTPGSHLLLEDVVDESRLPSPEEPCHHGYLIHGSNESTTRAINVTRRVVMSGFRGNKLEGFCCEAGSTLKEVSVDSRGCFDTEL